MDQLFLTSFCISKESANSLISCPSYPDQLKAQMLSIPRNIQLLGTFPTFVHHPCTCRKTSYQYISRYMFKAAEVIQKWKQSGDGHEHFASMAPLHPRLEHPKTFPEWHPMIDPRVGEKHSPGIRIRNTIGIIWLWLGFILTSGSRLAEDKYGFCSICDNLTKRDSISSLYNWGSMSWIRVAGIPANHTTPCTKTRSNWAIFDRSFHFGANRRCHHVRWRRINSRCDPHRDILLWPFFPWTVDAL